MNLDYTIKQLAKITNGQIEGDEEQVVNQIIIDSRNPTITSQSLFVALKGNKTNGHNYCENFIDKGGKLLLVSNHQKSIKNKNITQLIVKDTLLALQLIAKHHRQQFNIPVIGITGSNGKTTVKEWLFHVLKSQFTICRSPKSYNSQIGVALSVLELNSNHNLGIFEAGISKVDEMESLESIIKPTIGIFTGIGDAHQQNFNSIEQKQLEKFKLFKSVKQLIKYQEKLDKFAIPFSDLAAQQNANLVYQTSKYLNIGENKIKKSLSTLPSISMRMERMEGKNGNIIINDAYTLDEKSLEIGIRYLNQISKNKKHRKVLIISPLADYNFSEKTESLLNSDNIDDIYLIGKDKIKLSKVKSVSSNVNEFLNKNIKLKNSTILITGTREAKLERIVSAYLVKNHITKLKVNLTAIHHNLNFYRSKLNQSTLILAMVKAQSYGGGIVEMAQFLETQHINYFGVAYADEGVTLRENGITKPIIVMNPESDAFNDIITNKLEPSIYSLEILDQFISTLIRHNIKAYPIHLKLDTGMNRLGFLKTDLNELTAQLKVQPEVYIKSVFSHLSVADNLEEEAFTNKQIKRFKSYSNQIQKELGYSYIEHIANSSATLNYSNSHFNMVRIGIGMFGLVDGIYKNHLEDVLTFETQISQIKQISKGDSVGYGRTFIAKSQITIAIIPVGYADGLRRELSQGKWQFIINKQSAPIIGNICMDMCMIDITNLDCEVGQSVQIFGRENSIVKMSKLLNTIPYEIISSISNRVHRIYTKGK